MGKSTPIIFIMFGVVLVAFAMLSLASYYGESDWTWMSEQVAGFVLLLMVFSVAFYTLMGWLRRR